MREFKMPKGWRVKWTIFTSDNREVFFKSLGDRRMVLMTRAVAVLHALSHRERHHSFLLSYTFFLRDFHVCLFFRIDLHRLLYPLVKWKVVKLFRTSTGNSEIRQSKMALIMSMVLSVFCNVLDGFLEKKTKQERRDILTLFSKPYFFTCENRILFRSSLLMPTFR